MWLPLIVFIIIAVVAIAITLYLRSALVEFHQQFEESLDDLNSHIELLPQFSYDIKFNPPVDNIDINNPYECTGNDLHKCRIDEPLSCVGCKNLISSCKHFDQDTKYIDSNGVESIIPKNDDPMDGYCLVIQTLAQRCNPYHGVLVLVQLYPGDTASFLICECLNPGFIGKTTITGACDEVFVCNGKVVDINVPFPQITCDCPKFYNAATVNSVPVCQKTTVDKFTDWSSIVYPYDMLDKSHFADTIASSFKGTKLKNPCSYCLITGQRVNGYVKQTDTGYACISRDQTCLPIRSNSGGRILKGAKGPDSMIMLNWTTILLYGKISGLDFNNMAIGFEAAGNEHVLEYFNLPTEALEKYAIDLRPHEIHVPGHIGGIYFDRVPLGECEGQWPSYTCKLSTFSSPGSLVTVADGIKLLKYSGREAPGSFLWGKAIWNTVELKMNESVTIAVEDGVAQFKINPYFRSINEYNDKIKFLFAAILPKEKSIYMVLTDNTQSYKTYTSYLISPNT